MQRFVFLVPAFLLLVLTGPAPAGKDASDYLTADGQFKETLQLKDVQGGFAGFTGWLWQIEKDGKWRKNQVFNQKLTLKEEGNLSKEQMMTLAKELAKYDLLNLKGNNKNVGANPHVVTIEFGKHKAEFTLGAGDPLPKADPASVDGRAGGIAQAVQSMLKGGKAGGEEK